MTVRDLQDSLVADLEKLFEHSRYKTPDGDLKKPNVFPQFLPKRMNEDDDDPFTYLIVRVDNGAIETPASAHKVATLILIGVFDDDAANSGHAAILEIMEKIQERYQKSTALLGLDEKTIVAVLDRDSPMTWALQDEESYPYFFGGINITWDLAAPRQEASDLT